MFKKSRFSMFGVLILGVVIFASPAYTYDHDVGVIDVWWPEVPDEPPDIFDPGSVISVACVVENFGSHAEQDFEVRCQIRDADSNDVEAWHSLQNVSYIDYKGNPDGNPHTVEVHFPAYIILTEYHCQYPVCRTELVGDEFPDNDDEVRFPGFNCLSVEEKPATFRFSIEVIAESDNCYQVRFSMPLTSWVKLDVFDVDGRWVKSLENDIYEPGSHAIVWDGRDNTGRKTSTGVYFVRIQADEFTDACKVVVIN